MSGEGEKKKKIPTGVGRKKKKKPKWEITHVWFSFFCRNPRRIFTVYFTAPRKNKGRGPIFIVSISYLDQAPICPGLRVPLGTKPQEMRYSYRMGGV